MNIRTLRASSLLTAGAIFAGGCAGLTPEQNAGVFGATGGTLAGSIARASGMGTGESIATGVAAGAVIGAVTYIIAKHEASERQKRIAEMRARRVYEARKAKLAAHKTRYIAVDTEKDEKTSASAKKSVMIWDTQSQEVVSNEVYDVKSPPAVGTTAKFDNYSAEYVGSGA